MTFFQSFVNHKEKSNHLLEREPANSSVKTVTALKLKNTLYKNLFYKFNIYSKWQTLFR